MNLEHEIGAIRYIEMQRSTRSSFVVSVNGLPMFIEYVYSDSGESALDGGVDLAAGSAALTANRDGFSGDMGEEFAQLICELVQDQNSVRFGKAMELSINFDSMTGLPDSGLVDRGGDNSQYAFRHDADCVRDGTGVYRNILERIGGANYPRNFHFKVESLAARRTTTTEAYISASALVAELNKQRSVKLARSWRAAIWTILNCEWALANGVAFYDGLSTVITDWDEFGGNSLDLQVFFQDHRVDIGFCFIADTEGLCSAVIAGDQPHRIFINPLLLTGETAIRACDALDLAYHEDAHLWEHHHGEAFCRDKG